MIGDATGEKETSARGAWTGFASAAVSGLMFIAGLVDIHVGDVSLGPYLFLLAIAAGGALKWMDGQSKEAESEWRPALLLFLALIIAILGRRAIDAELMGVPIVYFLASLVAIPAAGMIVAEIADELRKSPRTMLWFSGALALVGIILLEESGWREEVLWHIRQDEALRFYLALVIALITCIAFREAGGHRIWIAMSLGVAVSGLLLPWYLTRFGFALPGFGTEFDFLRRPGDNLATAIALAGGGGGLAVLLIKHPLAPLASAAGGGVSVVLCLTSMDPFDGFLEVTLLAGFYITLVSAAIAVVLSLWLLMKLANPPPDLNVIPRMKEQFPHL